MLDHKMCLAHPEPGSLACRWIVTERGSGGVYDKNLVFRLSRIMRDAGVRCGLATVEQSKLSILSFIGELEAAGEAVQVKTVVGSGLFGTPPTVLNKLGGLEKAGWIERHIDPDDARARRLALTPQSRKAFSKMSSEVSRLMGTAD